MAQVGLAAGLAVGVTDVSGCHCLTEAIGAVYELPHGVCCAATMPLIMEYNLPVAGERYARLAEAFGAADDGMPGEESAGRAIEFVRRLNRELGIPALSRMIEARDLDLLAEKPAANTSTASNPRDAGVAEFRAMFVAGLASWGTGHDRPAEAGIGTMPTPALRARPSSVLLRGSLRHT